MNFMSQLYNLKNKLTKVSIWVKLMILLLLIYVLNGMVIRHDNSIESFTPQQKQFELKRDDLFDDFYVNIYDKLVHNDYKNEYEVGQIVKNARPSENSRILDIGSGTGHHVNLFTKKGYDCIGVDNSSAMIRKSKETYPTSKFKRGDVSNSMLFTPESFTHITCFYFTVYYLKDKRTFFSNCFRWLKPGGRIIIHLVNKNKFDPIIPVGNPVGMVNVQKYAKERITSSVVKFKSFRYKSQFELAGDVATFKEMIKFDKDGKMRVNEHILHMDSQMNIVTMMKESGFILQGKISLHPAQYDHQYLYILQKPE